MPITQRRLARGAVVRERALLDQAVIHRPPLSSAPPDPLDWPIAGTWPARAKPTRMSIIRTLGVGGEPVPMVIWTVELPRRARIGPDLAAGDYIFLYDGRDAHLKARFTLTDDFDSETLLTSLLVQCIEAKI